MQLLKKALFLHDKFLDTKRLSETDYRISVFKVLNWRTFPAAFGYMIGLKNVCYVDTTLPVFAGLC